MVWAMLTITLLSFRKGPAHVVPTARVPDLRCLTNAESEASVVQAHRQILCTLLIPCHATHSRNYK
jgi:hypothetical protein